MDPDIAAALYGGGAEPRSHVTEMPVQRIEGDPEAGMSGLAKLGKLLTEQRAPVLLRGDTPGDIASGIAGGLTGNLDQRLPFGIGDAIKADREAAAQRNPNLMHGADVVGMVASPIGMGARAEGAVASSLGERLLESGARSAATAGMYGAARSVGDANPDDDIKTQAMEALAAGAHGAGVGAAAGGAAGLLGEVAPVARRFAMGGTAKDYGDIVKEQGTRSGIDYIAKDLGKIPEQQGLTNLLMPQSKAGYAKRAATRAEEDVGPALGATLRKAEAEIPAGAINKQAVISPLQREADALDNSARPGSRQYDQTIKQAAVAPFETPTDVAELKRAYEGESYAKGTAARDARYATAQKAGADATRAHLSDVMNSADPVTAAAFEKQSRDFADTKLVEGMAANASKYDFAAPLGGAVAGGFIGHETGHDARSTLEGAAAGALAGRYGADLTANLARGGERILETPALARLGGALSSKMSTAGAQDVGGETRGHLIPQAIQDALRDNKLGPYSNEFAKAAMSPEPGALGVTFSRLSRDPQFEQYKRMLQEMTGGMQ